MTIDVIHDQSVPVHLMLQDLFWHMQYPSRECLTSYEQ